jgi:hypothetical protein
MLFFILSAQFAYATETTIEFFSSNNTGEIDLQTAYQRLNSKFQLKLQSDTIKILQNYHIEQGQFEDILGTYQMSTDKNVTADNSEIFHTSPQQLLTNNQAFLIATDLANVLNQDSIAVFIPNKQDPIGNIVVRFVMNQLSINDMINTINEKLPSSYSQAFSLHLSHTREGFEHAKVESIEWLGNNISENDIKKAFPQGQITTQQGSAYLVYQNGNVDKIN